MLIGQAGKNQMELKIVGYQHPNAQDNFLEANWLKVAVMVQTPQAKWSAEAPVMMANELDRFMDWLQAIRGNKENSTAFDFEDTTLYVELKERDGHQITLEFHMHLEFRNPADRTQKETRVAVTLMRAEFDQWIRELRKYAEEYPVRYVFEA